MPGGEYPRRPAGRLVGVERSTPEQTASERPESAQAPSAPVADSPRRRLLEVARALIRPLYWWYERRILTRVRKNPVPRHLGLILDGNRRFARSIGEDFRVGHELGVEKAYEVLRWCLDLRIPAVTVWVMSTDNLRRDPEEVGHLLATFVREAKVMAGDPRIHANRVRIRVIGQLALLPEETLTALRDLESATAGHDGLLLNIALGYGGREEIVDAVRRLLEDGESRGLRPGEIASALSTTQIGEYLYTAGLPDPDFIIRTSGELRLGGFLLWQSAYSEYYFCEALWPDFRRVDFLRAIRSYQGRHRRFGR